MQKEAFAAGKVLADPSAHKDEFNIQEITNIAVKNSRKVEE